jgi:hypothetical protein
MPAHGVFRRAADMILVISERSSCAEVDLTNPVIYAIFRSRFHRSAEYL